MGFVWFYFYLARFSRFTGGCSSCVFPPRLPHFFAFSPLPLSSLALALISSPDSSAVLGPLQTLNSLLPHQSSFVVDTLTAGTRDNAKVWALPLVQRPGSIFPCPLRFAIAVSL